MLVGRRGHILEHQKRPRRILPDHFLQFLIFGCALCRIGVRERLIKERVDLRILVIGLIIQDRRLVLRIKRRAHAPVRVNGGIGPANDIEAVGRLLRILVAVDLYALPGFKRPCLGLDAYLRELLLDELHRLHGRRVVIGRPERRLKTVRIACFFQELTGFLRIIGPGTKLNGIGNLLGNHAVSRTSIAAVCHFAERLLIDGIVDSLPHLGVVKRLLVHIHGHIAHDNRRHHVDHQIGIGLQNRNLLHRRHLYELCLARLQHRRSGAVFHHRHPAQRLKFGQSRHAVVRVAFNQKLLGGIEADQLIGPRAAGFKSERLLRLRAAEQTRAGDCSCAVGEPFKESRHRTLQSEADGVLVCGFDFFDKIEEISARAFEVLTCAELEAELDGFSIQDRAVVKLHALPELKGINAPVRTDVDRFCELRRRLEILVKCIETLIKGTRRSTGKVVRGVPGIHGRETSVDGDGERFELSGMSAGSCGGEHNGSDAADETGLGKG